MRDTELQLDWLTELSALQSLTFQQSSGSFVLPSVFSTMTRLSSLNVYGTSHACIIIYFDWAGLTALTALDICGSARFDTGLTSLAALQSLRQVVFTQSQSFDASTAKQIGLFAYALGARRDVSLTFC